MRKQQVPSGWVLGFLASVLVFVLFVIAFEAFRQGQSVLFFLALGSSSLSFTFGSMLARRSSSR